LTSTVIHEGFRKSPLSSGSGVRIVSQRLAKRMSKPLRQAFHTSEKCIPSNCETSLNNDLRAALRQRKGENMKYLFTAALIAGTVAGFASANAEGGCGPGWHRNPYGVCRPNGGAVVVAPAVVPGAVVVAPAPVVVAPRRVCPVGFVWAYGRCRPV
jgi:hypothetical protein